MIKPFKAFLKSMTVVMLFGNLGISSVFSQNNADSLYAAKLLESAKESAKEENYFKSSDLALQATEAFAQLGYWGLFREGYYRIFLNGHFSRDYDNAVLLIEKGIKKVPQNEYHTLAKMNTYLGYSYNAVGDIVSSVEAYEKSIPFSVKAKDTVGLHTAYTNVGLGYLQFSDYSKAIFYLKNAQSSGNNKLKPRSVWKTEKLLGQAYFYNGNMEEAYKTFVRAKKLFDPSDGTFELFFAQILSRQKRFKKAIHSAKQAIRLAKNEEGIAAARKVLSEIYLAAYMPESAIALIKKILPIYRHMPNKRESGKLYVLLADAYRMTAEYDKALEIYQKALTAFMPDFKSDSLFDNPKNSLLTEIHLPEIYNGKGHCFYGKYKITKKGKWLFKAEKNYERAISDIQKIKLNYDETESRLYLGNLTHSYYEAVIRVKLELYSATLNKKYKEEAFTAAQKSNAFVLRDLLNQEKSMEAAGVPEEIINQWKRNRKTENTIKRKIEKSPTVGLDSLQRILFDAKRKRYDLLKNIEKKYPKYIQLRNNLEVATISNLQEKTDRDRLLIKYFRGENVLYIFSISAQDYNIDTIRLPPDFDLLINQYRKVISDLDFINDSTAVAEQLYLKTAHRLFQLLLKKPLTSHNQKSKINRLTIVGEGVLSVIPFQALLMKKTESWHNPENLIVTQFAVSYSYFCKLLLEEPEQGSGKERFISFGIEFDEYTLKYLQKISKDEIKNKAVKAHLRSGNFSTLPFSDEEAKELATLMEGKSWINQDATKSNFLQSTPHADIIHVATHSILNIENPNESALVFTKTKDSSDNLLRLSEVYNLELNADMLVLSACNSGYGSIENGEGINSLARAFNYSGIPSVIATFWGISDESSKKIMELYYKFLKEGLEKDIALQRAQLSFLENDQLSSPSFRIPVYWAAWAPIGTQNSIGLNQYGNIIYLLFALFGLFAVSLSYAYRKRHQLQKKSSVHSEPNSQ